MENQNMKLTSGLRLVGVIALAASAVIFMFQGFFALSSFERFLSFGAVAAGLGALGLFVGTRMQEPKSARTFLGLAAASTPVLFSQLGAMIYGLLSPTPNIPQALIVTAPSLAIWALSVAVTLAVMAPILMIGFGAFYRQESRRLMALLFAGSLALLIPSREATVAAILGFSSLAVLLAAFQKKTARQDVTATPENDIARLIVFLPQMILIGRGLLYSPNELFLSMTLAGLAVLCHVFRDRARVQTIVRLATSMAAFFALDFFITEALHLPALRLLLAAYPAALLLHSPRWPGQRDNDLWTVMSRVALVLLPMQALASSFTLLPATVAILIGAFASGYGISRREHALFLSGLSAISSGLIFFASESWAYLSQAPWISLAVLGVGVILLSGWLEKNRSKVTKWSDQYREHFGQRPDQAVQQ